MSKPPSNAVLDTTNPLAASLEACWPMLEGSGTTSADKTTNGHTLTFSGSAGHPTWSTNANGPVIDFGTALQVPIAVTSPLSLSTNWTIAFRHKLTSNDIHGQICGASSSANNFIWSYGGNWMGLRVSGVDAFRDATDTTFTTLHNWVIVYDHSVGSGAALLYKDGALVSTNSISSANFTLNTVGNCWTDTSGSLIGQLEYIYVWSGRSLSGAEVATLNSDPYAFITAGPTLNGSPTTAAIGRSFNLSLSGLNNTWLSENPVGLFTISGGTGATIAASAVVTGDNAALIRIYAGTARGTLTITDTSSSKTVAVTVVDAPAGGLLTSSFALDNTIVGGASGNTFVQIDKNRAIRQYGPITRVIAKIGATAGANGLRFQVRRYNGSTYDFVGESELLTAGGTGDQSFDLASPIDCQPGDLPGVWLNAVGDTLKTTTGGTGTTIAYDAGHQASNGWSPGSGISTQYIDMDFRCTSVDGIGVGDSRESGIPNYLTWKDSGGISGTIADQPMYQLQGLIDPTRLLWRYQNWGKSGQTFAYVATEFVEMFSTYGLIPASVWTQCGWNDVNGARSTAAVLADVDACIAVLPANSHWFIDQCWPSTGSDPFAADVDTLNAAIAAHVGGLPNVSIVTTFIAMGQLRGAGPYYDLKAAYSADGIHVNAAGDAEAGVLRKVAYDAPTVTGSSALIAGAAVISGTGTVSTAGSTITGTGSLVCGAAAMAGTGTQTAGCVLSGTVVNAAVADIVAGGKTIILTLASDTWVASGATFNAQRQNIINGLTAATSQTHGWNNEVKAKEVVGAVVRTSNSVVTITLSAEAGYAITASETITATVPATSLTGGVARIAAPAFSVLVGGGQGRVGRAPSRRAVY